MSVLQDALHRAAHGELVTVARAQLAEVEEDHLSSISTLYEAKRVLDCLNQSLYRQSNRG